MIETESKTVQVMLLMVGGHQCEFSLAADAPLLRELFQALINPRENRDRLFEIPMGDEDNSTVYIVGQSLVAIATDPAIELQPMQVTNAAETMAQSASVSPVQVIESRVVQLDDFLPHGEYQRLLETCLPQSSGMEISGVQLPTPDSFAPFRELILNRVGAVLPDVLLRLGIPDFPLPLIEAVAIPDSEGKPEPMTRDDGSPETAVRVLNFVYYFSREPKPFTGGELLIYNSKIEGESLNPAETFQTVEPRNNSVVFFFSSDSYEVLPVRGNSPAFSDRCFKVKGWLRKS
ncbi:2OG-Fe(II) oxygenase [Phormidium sp. CCY1219]|uniref:2OG-Fe(II) oxygenase n=1 Tax=Phormidium sp. CCY1219 TaxID=2886104 RepID=UPI002D1F56F5|nr:2OG-Fe(II) oxygenase [Phormidium sp. CCY1219]MEB3828531.1 2OG-Fe(II) oxygenase [Phormidium sp. CCY1219]